MKKIFIGLSMILMILLIGCSSAAPMEYQTSIHDVFSYSYTKGEFNNKDESDIIKYLIDYSTDRVLMMEFAVEEELISDFTETERSLIEKVYLITEGTSVSYQELFDSSSQEFNAYAVAAGVELTIDDIVSFNDLKLKLVEAGVVFISKRNFIEFKLGESLTSEQISGYDLLQELYLDLLNNYGSYDLRDKSYEAMISDMDNAGLTVAEADLAILEAGFELINK
jgi:hypothetical protein